MKQQSYYFVNIFTYILPQLLFVVIHCLFQFERDTFFLDIVAVYFFCVLSYMITNNDLGNKLFLKEIFNVSIVAKTVGLFFVFLVFVSFFVFLSPLAIIYEISQPSLGPLPTYFHYIEIIIGALFLTYITYVIYSFFKSKENVLYIFITGFRTLISQRSSTLIIMVVFIVSLKILSFVDLHFLCMETGNSLELLPISLSVFLLKKRMN